MKLLLVVFALLAVPAQAQTTYRDWAGREVGTSTTRGNTTTYRDRMGRQIGTATRSGGSTTRYDRRGRQVGTARR
jgi:hypothetical protein